MTAPLRVRGYAVEGRLGGGASGDVWRARALSSGALVALKRIPVADEEQRVRARAEAALLGALDHPNLVRLHGLVELDAAVVLVLDLADGGTLAELLAGRDRLTPGEVVTALAPIADALAHLHDAGVLHGDVSPANILFTANGTPMLADVGAARLVGDDAAVAASAYVDPAVAAGFVPGPPSDAFMLAGVALHALTGAPPWPDADPGAALERAAGGRLDDVGLRLADADVPPAMAAPLVRALDVDPQRRGTAAELALDLGHGATPVAVDRTAGRVSGSDAHWDGPRHAAAPRGDPPPTRLVARPRPVIPRPPVRERRRRLPLIAALSALGVLAGAGIAWAVVGTPPPRHQASPPSTSPSSSPSDAEEVGVSDWVAELDRLDAVRGRAYAARRAVLLRRVYLAGPLLAADTAMLNRLVPRGCGLDGVRTRYSALQVSDRAGSAVLIAQARLAPAELRCAGVLRDSAPGAEARLRIVLRSTGTGVRIADEQRLDPPPPRR
jgi:serine/threonine protein kinase